MVGSLRAEGDGKTGKKCESERETGGGLENWSTFFVANFVGDMNKLIEKSRSTIVNSYSTKLISECLISPKPRG